MPVICSLYEITGCFPSGDALSELRLLFNPFDCVQVAVKKVDAGFAKIEQLKIPDLPLDELGFIKRVAANRALLAGFFKGFGFLREQPLAYESDDENEKEKNTGQNGEGHLASEFNADGDAVAYRKNG